MKTCSYCGQANDESASTCRYCGMPMAEAESAPPSHTAQAWSRAAVLQSEVEARRLELELDQRQIPHVLVSYADSAFDGLYQAGKGWGHVETPIEHVAAIRALLAELRAGVSDASGPSETG